MRKFIYFVVTYAVCLFLGLRNLWLGFVPAMVIMLLTRLSDSFVWEIPMGVLSCSICTDAFGGDTAALLRTVIPIAAVLIAYSAPIKLSLFFPVAVCAIIFKTEYMAAAVFAMLWCSIKFLFMYSTTNKTVLQAES